MREPSALVDDLHAPAAAGSQRLVGRRVLVTAGGLFWSPVSIDAQSSSIIRFTRT